MVVSSTARTSGCWSPWPYRHRRRRAPARPCAWAEGTHPPVCQCRQVRGGAATYQRLDIRLLEFHPVTGVLEGLGHTGRLLEANVLHILLHAAALKRAPRRVEVGPLLNHFCLGHDAELLRDPLAELPDTGGCAVVVTVDAARKNPPLDEPGCRRRSDLHMRLRISILFQRGNRL